MSNAYMVNAHGEALQASYVAMCFCRPQCPRRLNMMGLDGGKVDVLGIRLTPNQTRAVQI